MKILIAGDWHSELHEEAVSRALRQLGHEVFRFSWHEYFMPQGSRFRAIENLFRRAQNKYLLGPLLSRINLDLIARAVELEPDMVFFYRGTHITGRTLREIKRRVPGVIMVGYNNDDPFSPMHPKWLWRHFFECVPEYDLMLAYRHSNVDDFRAAGARRVELLRSWYVAERNHPITLDESDKRRFETDVVFVGHYEDDGRLELLESVAAAGVRLRIFGPGYDWDPVLKRSGILRGQVPVRLVWADDYNRALCGASIALCFLSKMNRDTYTRRCFEIPATGTMMLAEYSDDLATMYSEGRDVELFRSAEEMIAKIRFYLSHDDKRRAVAAAGYRNVTQNGHDVVSRMREVMKWVQESDAPAPFRKSRDVASVRRRSRAARRPASDRSR